MSSRDSYGLKSFEGKPMKPHEFRNQVRKIFKVPLDEEQLVAIVAHFDKDGDGTIDYKEVADLMLHPEKLQDPAKRRRKRPAEHLSSP